jgi:hypothetical protein
MTTMLIVMRGVDLHTIRETWVGMVVLLGVWSVLLFRLNYRSGLCGRFDVAFEEKSL